MFKKVLFVAVFAMALAGVAQAADFSKLPDPYKNIKQGQWVKHKGMGGTETKQTVTKVEGSGDDMVITVSTEISMAGQAMPAQEMTINVKEAKAQQAELQTQAPDAKISEESITVNGKSYNAVVVEMTQQGMTTKMYLSEQIPVNGMVKMEMSGMPEPVMEVVEFGG